MADTINTAGLTPALRAAIRFHLDRERLWVPCVGEISEHAAEMIEHFGSPKPAGYMSEECGWRLDQDDADAIANA